MKSINITGITPEQHKRLKQAALDADMTVKEYVILKLGLAPKKASKP